MREHGGEIIILKKTAHIKQAASKIKYLFRNLYFIREFVSCQLYGQSVGGARCLLYSKRYSVK